MSIIIKGMDILKSCEECRYKYCPFCRAEMER